MTTIQFYHLTATPLERALPKLLEKAVAGKMKTVLVDESEARLEHLNQWLWTYDPGSFLPHGSSKDGHEQNQPIWLTTQVEKPNDATLLVLTSGTVPTEPAAFERIIDIFDGNDPVSVENARTRWKNYKDAGHALTYLKQTPQGSWEQKAVA